METDPKKNRKDKVIIRAISGPSTGEAGKTGDWRSQTPIIDHDKCVRRDSCLYCWMYCPDGVITREFPLEIDLEHCKGCGICAEECPVDAIEMKDGRKPSE
jgi:pyruvate ferredoxin oxidoreductase delta subunit